MKKALSIVLIVLFNLIMVFSCTTGGKTNNNVVLLDQAIKTAAENIAKNVGYSALISSSANTSASTTEITMQTGNTGIESIRQQAQKFNQKPKIAVINFSSPSTLFSTYVVDELSKHLIDTKDFIVVERKELDLISQENKFQMSGDVSDESMVGIGKKLGAQFIVSGSLASIGEIYRFRIKVLSIETAQNLMQPDWDINSKENKVVSLLAGAKPPSEKQPDKTKQTMSTYTAHDTETFTQAIKAINESTKNGTYTITVNGSFTLNPVIFTGNAIKTIVIKGDKENRVITRNGNGSLFTINSGITLNIGKNIMLNGNRGNTSIVSVSSGSTLILNDGASITGAGYSGVTINGGTFTMKGGTVNGNIANNICGGGVYLMNGIFTMSGGEITGNSCNGGTSTKENPEIKGGAGGGVYLNGGIFNMSGGTIRGNTVSGDDTSWGGGVHVSTGAIFAMSGGTISGNTSKSKKNTGSGGGVGVNSDGIFKKTGGTIDNTNSPNVVVVFGSNKIRYKSAGPGIKLDSTLFGKAGGWE